MGSVKDVLTALDDSKTKLYHFKAVIVSGMGFFTDAYDLFSVSLITKLLGRIYYHVPGSAKPGTLPPTAMSALNGVALCGTLLGQLFFGLLGDKMGRKKVYGFTLFIMALSSIGSGFSFGHSPQNVIATLCFFRFWLGFGIGGDYPLSATIMAEYASKKTRGSFIAAVFAMQGFGILTGGLVGMAVSGIFKALYGGSLDSNGVAPAEADYIWRIVLMFGALPALLTYYWRTQMPETARYTALVAKNADQARKDMEKVLNVEIIGVGTNNNNNNVRAVTGDKAATKQPFGLFSKQFLSRHGLHLLGTSLCWFFVDVAYYSQNLFQKEIFTAVGWLPSAKSMGAIEEVFKISYCQFLIAFCGTVPGYWLTVALIDRIGRFAIQIIGFLFMTIFMFGLAIPYEHWLKNHAGFLVMYGLTFFFANFGPNATTFIVPAEIFPARLRSTCHGISAAAGKAGAIVGAFGFMYAAQNRDKSKADPGYGAGIGIRYSLMILGGINLLGLLFTFMVPEAKGRSLEDMSGENDEDDEVAVIKDKEVQMLQNV